MQAPLLVFVIAILALLCLTAGLWHALRRARAAEREAAARHETWAQDEERFRTWRLDIDASLATAIEAAPPPPQFG